MGAVMETAVSGVAVIPKDDLLRARRKLCRKIAASLAMAMAETDTGIPLIAVRLGVSESVVRHWFKRLLDGTMHSLDHISDLAWSMGCSWEVSVSARIKEIPAAANETTEVSPTEATD